MFLRYGNYTHSAGEVSLTISRQGQFVNGMEQSYTERWDIQGRLQINDQGSPAANQAAMNPVITNLQNAYALQGNDLTFFTDGGIASSHQLLSAQAYGGVRIVQRPSFPVGRGAEYSTFRNYSIVAEATFLNTNLGVIAFHETINFTGGGPKFVLLETLNGAPQKQLVRQQTTYKVSQSGEAIGLLGYPSVPSPIAPGDVHQDRTVIQMHSPSYLGAPGKRSFTNFRITWSYFMESANPINGLPTAPVN